MSLPFGLELLSPQVSAEVLRVAEHRHRRGLMYPQIYHILTKVHSQSLFTTN